MKDLDRRTNISPSQEKKTAAITVNEKVIRLQSQEDLSDSETDSEVAESTSDRQLRNRSLLQKPKRSEDHIMDAESYLDDYNPKT
ncbi:hypothetical protein TNIN_220641 [Trichonephila inaurata madagascariensis]|uniref:Uncharacterized protein n=1 Tax=Trichonephila inaurata madagascariensis TaxID=2747483 RepID=A0A8X7CCZ3_9ARAC|nr:hypothetical protein TNIN_220641 [Trichonephila inaurata madagascariensis]